MARINRGQATPHDLERLDTEGRYLDGAFYLGSHALYDWLRGLSPEQARGIGMTRVSHINELYGNNEALEREQRETQARRLKALDEAIARALADVEAGRVYPGV